MLDDAFLTRLAREHGTPLWVYDATVIAARVASLRAFDVIRYAQKANSNLAILRLMRSLGAELDAVSAGEVARGLAAGFARDEIVFTADLFDRAALACVVETGVRVNLGSMFMIDDYGKACPGREVMLRINPGFGHGHTRKVQTGGEASKHGIWHVEIPAAIERAHKYGLRVTGLHVHIGSGSDFEHLTYVCDAVGNLAQHFGRDLSVISAGGGLPVPYGAQDDPFDVERYSETWLATRDRIAHELGRKLQVEVEPGRFLVAESGCLLTEVRGTKHSGPIEYVLVDAGFNDLLRPAMYGSLHQISALGRTASAPAKPRVVAGPLCESGDVFTQGPGGELMPQMLPDVVQGDILCVHDTGAYGASMSSNYNARPFAAEVLVTDGVARVVRARQTVEQMLENESSGGPL
ncbi:MAG: diaminopimelate decarboxylase [Planctomycetes bacterium]|nr:diaminopimelate decarboxylase [Planctomycetota bacterium]